MVRRARLVASFLIGVLPALAGAAASASAQTLADVIAAARAATVEEPEAEASAARPSINGAFGRASGVSGEGLFGSVEIRSDSLAGLPQWTRVLERMRIEGPDFERCAADPAACTTPVLESWRAVIVGARALPRGETIKFVNDFFNRWPYKQDRAVYGSREYWASPREFITRSGDCEDYAIAKYFALRQLGFDKEDLRVVILVDEIRGIGHAVLAVRTAAAFPKDRLVLDSLSNLLLPHDRYKHYVPQYSMNETTRWAHIGGFARETAPVYQGLIAGQ